MPRKMTTEEALTHGITTNHEQMENGELRFRLVSNDGTSCMRIQATDTGAWQNSHSHATLRELCVVQTGWIVFVEYDEDTKTCTFKKVNAGEICQSRPRVPHNMYVSANSVHYSVKFGDLSVNDWLPSPELDALTKHMSEDELLSRVSKGGKNK